MNANSRQLTEDVVKIQQIAIIPTLLNVICETTGMGFAAVARVTDRQWITCSVLDKINFGLQPGDELKLETTICHEVRESRKLVVFDNADNDPDYKDHHTPALYKIKSYISVPIIEKNGVYFGSLCAIDPQPHALKNEKVIGLFTLFAELIAFHLEAAENVKKSTDALDTERTVNSSLRQEVYSQKAQLDSNETLLNKSEDELKRNMAEMVQKDISISRLNEELRSLAYISSHDLQEPLRKIRMFSNLIHEKEKINFSEQSLHYFTRINDAAARLQSLLSDLLTFSTNIGNYTFQKVSIEKLVLEALTDLKEELNYVNAVLTVNCNDCQVTVIPFQIRQLLFNLLSNAVKFASPGKVLEIKVTSQINTGKGFGVAGLDDDTEYCLLTIEDNGIGFDQQFNQKIFEIFQRLKDDRSIAGTGIGLAIVKKVVANHNGYIIAYGEENKGATFNIYLPVLNQ